MFNKLKQYFKRRPKITPEQKIVFKISIDPKTMLTTYELQPSGDRADMGVIFSYITTCKQYPDALTLELFYAFIALYPEMMASYTKIFTEVPVVGATDVWKK